VNKRKERLLKVVTEKYYKRETLEEKKGYNQTRALGPTLKARPYQAEIVLKILRIKEITELMSWHSVFQPIRIHPAVISLSI